VRRPANAGSIFPAVEHLSEIAMHPFEGSLVGIGSLRLFGVYAISPPAGGAFPPPSRNALPRKIAGGVGHPKQNQKNKDFLQLKCSTREQRSFLR